MITKIIIKRKIIQVKLYKILMKILYSYIKRLGSKRFQEHNSNDFRIIYPGFPPKNLKTLKDNRRKKEVCLNLY